MERGIASRETQVFPTERWMYSCRGNKHTELKWELSEMLLSEEQIGKNISWLLTNGSVTVGYLTHKHLLNTPLRSKLMRELWREVEVCSDAQEIFSGQEADGSWCSGGSWAPKPSYKLKGGYSAFTPKYVTAVWILSILGDMGFDIRNELVKKAYDYTLSFQRPNGLFSRYNVPPATHEALETDNPPNSPCNLSVFLLGLGKVNTGGLGPLKKSYDLLVSWQRSDGGWVHQRHKEEFNWTRSCPWVTHHAAAALYHSQRPEYQDALRKSLKFLVWHLSLKKDHEIRRFFYRGHSMVRELLMFSETGIGMDEHSVRVVLEWLLSMYDSTDGRFRYRGKPISKHTWREDGATAQVLKYRLYHLIKDDWLTYYMTRIAVNTSQT